MLKKNIIRNSLLKIAFTLSIVGQAFLNFNVNIKNAHATENSVILNSISEENYNDMMTNVVKPYVESKQISGYIENQNGVDLYYEQYLMNDAKANIVISHGFTENINKYYEIIYYFLREGYNVFAVEHRGHGRSGNLGFQDSSQMHIESFDEYVTDYKIFLDQIVVPNNQNKKMFLFAHSMGGAIGTAILEEYPEYFDSAILSSPMLQVNTGIIPNFIANILVKIANILGYNEEYALGQKPYSEGTMEGANSTSSSVRYEYVNNIVKSNESFQKGGASFQWLSEAFRKTNELVKKENAEKVEIPVLLFQAGDDSYVAEKGQNQFKKYAKNCELVRIDDSKHEIYNEVDEIQKPYLEKVLNFFSSNL